VVVEVLGKPVEIQVRTTFQHIWGEISEKYADLYGSEIKYGGGSQEIRRTLKRMSTSIARYERLERRLARLRESDKVKEIREEMRELRLNLAAAILDDEISRIENKKGEEP
jgi:ppGpp synthetase/RelA/SpoT-type nucleotidyltranferase